jgi:hypothetical protein
MSFRFLKITILPNGIEDAEAIDVVVDGLRTMLPEGRDFLDDEGILFILIETDQELMDESICLGTCYAQLREEGYDEPFDVELVVRDDMPGHSFTGPIN